MIRLFLSPKHSLLDKISNKISSISLFRDSLFFLFILKIIPHARNVLHTLYQPFFLALLFISTMITFVLLHYFS